MTMLAPESNSLTITRIDDEIYKLVDWFYPRTGFMQVLQLYMRPDDIMNIMNCDYEAALSLYYEIRGYFGDNEMRILIPHFCHYMGVDESFIHLFLASLKKHQKFKPEKKSEETTPVNGSSANGKPLRLAQVIENLSKGLQDSPETIKERIRQWHLANPYGEAMFKRDDNWRVFIYPDEVASVLKVSLRKAQIELKELREYYGITPKKPVSIKKFCTYFDCEEADVRKAIACMYGEDYIAP
jgi:hypothetical protein